jgi:formylglycine-generating enzyme required for sulfatase activity
MRITLPSNSRRSSRTWRKVLFGVFGFIIVVIAVSMSNKSFSGLSASAGVGQVSSTATPTELSTPTELTILTETPMATFTSAPEVEIIDAKGISMRLVPAGEFTMGGPAETAFAECQKLYIGGACEQDWFLDETPAHTVFLNGFYMDTYEVSNASYRECVNGGACLPPVNDKSENHSGYFSDPQYDNYPVIYVDWNMANAYCEWRGARLPTEAEWEKAARGTDGRIYPWGNSFDGTDVNFCDSNCLNGKTNGDYNDGYGDTAPVDSYPDGVSVYGIFNLSGNVWEWLADWYGPMYYADSPFSDPTGPVASDYASGEGRSVRGGSWADYGDVLRSSNRYLVRPVYYNDMLGIRCVSPLSSGE